MSGLLRWFRSVLGGRPTRSEEPAENLEDIVGDIVKSVDESGRKIVLIQTIRNWKVTIERLKTERRMAEGHIKAAITVAEALRKEPDVGTYQQQIAEIERELPEAERELAQAERELAELRDKR